MDKQSKQKKDRNHDSEDELSPADLFKKMEELSKKPEEPKEKYNPLPGGQYEIFNPDDT